MSSMSVLYRIVVRAARAGAWFFRHGSGKVARGIEGRRHTQTVLGNWADGERNPDRPVVWIHAPSVGEALQAEAVALALAKLHLYKKALLKELSQTPSSPDLDYFASLAEND